MDDAICDIVVSVLVTEIHSSIPTAKDSLIVFASVTAWIPVTSTGMTKEGVFSYAIRLPQGAGGGNLKPSA